MHSSDFGVVTHGDQVVEIDPGWRKNVVKAIAMEPWLDAHMSASSRGQPGLPAILQRVEAIRLS
jgi:hypothetical protein